MITNDDFLDPSSKRHLHFMKLRIIENELSGVLFQLNSNCCESSHPELYDQYLKLHHDGLLLRQIIEKMHKRIQSSIYITENISSAMDRLIRKYPVFKESFSVYFSKAKLHH